MVRNLEQDNGSNELNTDLLFTMDNLIIIFYFVDDILFTHKYVKGSSVSILQCDISSVITSNHITSSVHIRLKYRYFFLSFST